MASTPFDNIIHEYLTASGTVDHVKLDMAQILEKSFANPVDILTVKVLKIALAQMQKEAMDALEEGEEEIDDGVTTNALRKCKNCDGFTERREMASCTAKKCKTSLPCCIDCRNRGFVLCNSCAQSGMNSAGKYGDDEVLRLCSCCDCFFESLLPITCGSAGCLNPVECCKDCDESGDAKCQECISGDVRDSTSDSDSSDEDGYYGDSGEEEDDTEEKLAEDPNRLTKCRGCRLFVRMFAMKDGVCQSEGCTNETLRCYACYTDGDVTCYNCQWSADHL